MDGSRESGVSGEQRGGHPKSEDAHTCCKRIYLKGIWDRRGHKCGRKAKTQHEGNWYCGSHDPVRREAKYAARNKEHAAKFAEEMRVNRIRSAAHDMLAVLREATEEVVAAGGNRTIHLDSAWLEKANAAIAKATGAA